VWARLKRASATKVTISTPDPPMTNVARADVLSSTIPSKPAPDRSPEKGHRRYHPEYSASVGTRNLALHQRVGRHDVEPVPRSGDSLGERHHGQDRCEAREEPSHAGEEQAGHEGGLCSREPSTS